MPDRYIVHVDMDAFFAAVEQRDNPALLGRPVIIGADPKGGRGRGVVSTCSYEARKYGVRSAMPVSEAWRRCPGAVFLPPDLGKYSAVSEKISRIFYDFTPDIEPVSIDEAFLDITGSWRLFGSPRAACLLIKKRVKEETGLTASVGLAPTKMAAKIASDLEKPDGFVEVPAGKTREFLAPLDIGRIWGLGPKAAGGLRVKGVNTIGRLSRMNSGELAELFGKHGPELLALASGRDDREVAAAGEAKSVGNEATFDADTGDGVEIDAALLALCDKVSSRLRSDGLKGRTITLKVRLEGFVTFTRSVTIPFATNFTEIIHARIRELYGAFDRRGKKVRLLGVKVSGLVPAAVRESLFEEETDRKLEGVHKAIEQIRGKFGRGAIYRAGGRKGV